MSIFRIVYFLFFQLQSIIMNSYGTSSQSSVNNSFIHFLSEKNCFFFTFNNITNLLKSHQNAFLDKSNHRKCVKLILTAFSDETKTHQYEFLRRNWSSTKIAIAIMVIILIYNKKEKPTTTTIDENSPWFVLIIMHPFHIQESHLQDLNHL